MQTIVECVPNFSEGRDAGKVEAIIQALRAGPDVYLLDKEMDAHHSTMGTLRIPISSGVGRLSWTYTNASMTTNSYDRMGRVQEYWQCTPYNCSGSNPWHAHYDFDLGGDVKDWTHPAGFTLTNSINGAQQVTQISYSPSDSTHPANLIPTVAYTPFGAVSKLQNGCVGTSCVRLQETYDYNKRLQPVRIQLGTSTTQNSELLPGVQLLHWGG